MFSVQRHQPFVETFRSSERDSGLARKVFGILFIPTPGLQLVPCLMPLSGHFSRVENI